MRGLGEVTFNNSLRIGNAKNESAGGEEMCKFFTLQFFDLVKKF